MTRRRYLFVVVALIAFLGTATSASACPVCIGDTDSQMAQGTNNAILFMLAMVALVQGAFVALFINIRRRTKLLRQRHEEFQLIEGGTR